MAAPKTIKEYIGKVLLLPHRWWGDKIAKDSYPQDWQKGHTEITLKNYVPAKGTDVESLQFVTDDGEEYLIVEKDLKRYWKDVTIHTCIYYPLRYYTSSRYDQLTFFH